MPNLAEYNMIICGPADDLDAVQSRILAGLYPTAGDFGDFCLSLPHDLWGQWSENPDFRDRNWIESEQREGKRPRIKRDGDILTVRGVSAWAPPSHWSERITAIWPVQVTLSSTTEHEFFEHFTAEGGLSRRIEAINIDIQGETDTPLDNDPLAEPHHEAQQLDAAELQRLRVLTPEQVRAVREQLVTHWQDMERKYAADHSASSNEIKSYDWA